MEAKKVIRVAGILVIISIVFGLTSLISFSSIVIKRGGNERTQQISEDFMLEQEIFIENTSKVIISFLNLPSEKLVTDGVVYVTLKQGNVEETAECKFETMPYRWSPQVFKFDTSKYKSGSATVMVTGGNLKYSNVQVLLSGGTVQKFPFTNVRINGENSGEPLYLVMNYEYWNIRLFTWMFLICLIVGLLLCGAWWFLIKKAKQNLVIIIAIVVVAITMMKNSKFYFEIPLNGWCTTPFLITFFDGVISKAFPGTVLHAFFPYISDINLRLIFMGIFILLVMCVLLFFKLLIKKSSCNVNITKFIYLYIMSPFFISWYAIGGSNWGRLDIIITTLFILSCSLIIKKKYLYLLPVLCVIAILTHQIFIFVFYPAIFLLCIYQIVVCKERKFVKPTIIHAFSSCLIALIAQFSGSTKYSFEKLLTIVSNRTNAPILPAMIEGEYYLSFFENITTYMQETFLVNTYISLFITVVMLLPLTVFLLKIAIDRALMATERKEKLLWLAFIVFPLASIPMFLTICDWGRIQLMVWNAIFFTSFTLLLLDNKVRIAFESVCHKYTEKYGKNWILALIIYISLLNPFDLASGILVSRVPITAVEKVFQVITSSIR